MEHNLRDLIRNMAKQDGEMYSKQCTVLEINEDDLTIDAKPLDGTPTIFDVKLKPSASKKGFVIFPMKDSVVTVSFLDANNAFVASVDSVESYIIENGEESLKKMLEDFIGEYQNHTHPTPSGPSSPATTASAFAQQFKERIKKLFKK